MKLRSPYDRLAGCVWLARFADKVRLMRRGLLPRDYLILLGHPRGVDGHFLRHFGLDKDKTMAAVAEKSDDEAVGQWLWTQSGVRDETVLEWNRLAPNLGRAGWPGEAELRFAIKRFHDGASGGPPPKSLFELICRDEDLRMPQPGGIDSPETSAELGTMSGSGSNSARFGGAFRW